MDLKTDDLLFLKLLKPAVESSSSLSGTVGIRKSDDPPPPPLPKVWGGTFWSIQVRSLTQFYSVDSSKSRIGVKENLRFASAVVDSVLGPPCLTHGTLDVDGVLANQ